MPHAEEKPRVFDRGDDASIVVETVVLLILGEQDVKRHQFDGGVRVGDRVKEAPCSGGSPRVRRAEPTVAPPAVSGVRFQGLGVRLGVRFDTEVRIRVSDTQKKDSLQEL